MNRQGESILSSQWPVVTDASDRTHKGVGLCSNICSDTSSIYKVPNILITIMLPSSSGSWSGSSCHLRELGVV
jgi:hypothetical protein